MALAERAVENGILPRLFTKDDFMFGTDPYAYLDSLKNPFDKQRALTAMCDMASAVGYNSFKRTYDDYRKAQRGIDVQQVENNTVALAQYGLQDAPEYSLGVWCCDELGVYRIGEGGQDIIACPHIIFPLRRLVNAYTGVEKIEVAYKRGVRWRSATKPKSILASTNKIIELADEGVGVNSDNAKELVKYLADVESLNYDVMPEIQAFDRLGWMDSYQSFSPYLKGAVFDEADAFRGVYNAVVKHHGSCEEWMKNALAIRRTSPVQTKMALAASLASAIVKPCGANPFFLHLWGGTEAGKAQPLDTKIITPNGYKLMGDIRIGDSVIGGDGKPKTVTGVFPQGEKEVYEITLEDGRKTRCCKDHLWNVTTRTRRNHNRGYTVMSLEDMLKRQIKTSKGYTYRIPLCGAVEFESNNKLPIDPYLLGALIGDGCLTMKRNLANGSQPLFFNNSEFDVLGKVMNKLHDIGAYMYFDAHSTNQFTIRNAKPLKRAIVELGLNVKSPYRFIPQPYLLSSVESRMELLRGLIDTDGHVSEKGSISYSTHSEKLAYDVQHLARSLGYKSSFTVSHRDKNEYKVTISANSDIFSSRKHTCKMENACKSRKRAEDTQSIAIVSIELVGREECQCIMVDSKEHTYLCDEFIVTHNTVALMFAASVWADPECGQYWKTFDSTAVGQEKMAGFLGNLPLIIDELMLVKDKKSFDDIVYRLSEGQGKTRGNKEGGVQRQETWRLSIITTGEQPLSSAASGGGAVNRVIDCECTSKLFSDPHWAANSFRENYGWFGERWVNWLMSDDNLELVKAAYKGYYRTITDKKITTEKQASAAALILTADSLSTEAFFDDGQALTLEDVEPFLTSIREVDQNERAYEYILEMVAMNDFRFSALNDDYVERWGWKEPATDVVCINRTIFGKLMADGGYDARSFLSWGLRNGIVHGSINHQTEKAIPTKLIKRNGVVMRYVELECDRGRSDFLSEEAAEWEDIVQDEQIT